MTPLKKKLEAFLEEFPMVKGAAIESLNLPIAEFCGDHQDEILTYKDVVISSVDEGFQSQFSFLILEKGSIIVFFLDADNFLCVYTNDTMPNKELALRMFQQYQPTLLQLIKEI